ncbi:hypothetical protein F5I97DRAFT_1830726 [Phlebopus sp. FC_14]|nr:hypothetical protein F5I97DRAFT_1830726 [Phlebopus sp. FC_14]
MSEMKAFKIIKLLHDNGFGPSLFLAISKNDEQAFQSALTQANVSADDLTLSQDEYDNLVKGVKPSGELDLFTWEDYYVVTSSPEPNDPFALLIFANTEKITSDNKLQFSTQADGLVSVSLTREYDKDRAIATVKFSGTRDGKDISGEKEQPPIHALNLQGPFRCKAKPAPRMMMMAFMEVTEHWYENPIVASMVTVFGLLGGPALGFQIFLLREMEEQEPLMDEITEESYRKPPTNYEGAPSAVNSGITSDLNQSFNDDPPDFSRSADDLTRKYEPQANESAAAALSRYIQSRTMPDLARFVDMFRALPEFEPWLRRFGSEVVD